MIVTKIFYWFIDAWKQCLNKYVSDSYNKYRIQIMVKLLFIPHRTVWFPEILEEGKWGGNWYYDDYIAKTHRLQHVSPKSILRICYMVIIQWSSPQYQLSVLKVQ